jgi:hypothetical protein
VRLETGAVVAFEFTDTEADYGRLLERAERRFMPVGGAFNALARIDSRSLTKIGPALMSIGIDGPV